MSWESAYRSLTRMLEPFADTILRKRIKAGKEDLTRVGERKGIASIARPDGKVVWMHGASVGETSMLLPLINRLLADDPHLHILVTSGTMTSARIMAERLPIRAEHQMVPLDGPNFVARFLEHWQPDLAIWAESEIWPNLVIQTKQSGAKMALINARLSQDSVDRWRAKRNFARKVFGCFDTILPADTLTHNALSYLTDSVVNEVGNLKSSIPPLDFNRTEALELQTSISERPVWLAASTHEAEEKDILAAHAAIRKKKPTALLVWVPRHPERGKDIEELCESHIIARRSLDQAPDAETSIYLMDTLGEMGLALSLADVAFVGGSLHPALTGHNPLEPARAGVPILTGPHVASFTDIYDQFFEAKAAMRVKHGKHLAKTVHALLNDGAASGQMAARAKAAAQESDSVLDFTAAQLKALL